MLSSTEHLPLNAYFMLPSCVPATSFENSGATLLAEHYREIIKHPRILGLGEMMNYPGVLSADRSVLDKLLLCHEANKIIDGHAPALTGNQMNAISYSGIHTDHECATIEEMQDRIRKGMYVAIREGSACKDLNQLIKGVTPDNERRCIFCTDDKHSEDILKNGHINNNIKLAIKNGIHPLSALRMATLNTAECYGLDGKIGAIAPGYLADLVIIDNFEEFNVLEVYKSGKKVAENDKLIELEESKIETPGNSVKVKKVTKEMLKIPITSGRLNIMKISGGSIVTEKEEMKYSGREFDCSSSEAEGALKMGVIERHNATGNIGLGIVKGFGFKGGAIAQTIAHDSHNLIVIGDNDDDMLLAIQEIERVQGGITLVAEHNVFHTLPLQIAGLMSTMPIQELTRNSKILLDKARQMGVPDQIEPFMTLGFLALPVIPEVRITDKGFFDVTQFKFIPVDQK
jgi:adenine deaminase